MIWAEPVARGCSLPEHQSGGLGHHRPDRTPRARSDSASQMALRPSSSSEDHFAISSPVRAHPSQRPVRGSSLQAPTQGEFRSGDGCDFCTILSNGIAFAFFGARGLKSQNPREGARGVEGNAARLTLGRLEGGLVKAASDQRFKEGALAGRPGFEPRLTESESAVLPLNYLPPGAWPSEAFT